MNFKRDLLCFSHLRWGFVYQRPQHLLSRAAANFRTFFIEEPFATDLEPHYKHFVDADSGVNIIAPYLPPQATVEAAEKMHRRLIDQFMADHDIDDFLAWYYTPMALGYTKHLSPSLVVYDCMDELSAFSGAPPVLRDREQELFRLADLVFTGGHSLYEAKRGRHSNVHAFPSSIDYEHFAKARSAIEDPGDQAHIAHPRIGYCGVIDERMDLGLLDGVAELRPEWQWIMVGPVVKIDPATLPRRQNIHYLGSKTYKELPAYMSGWDAAMLPFARNEATRFISPTKTPEYLAAGKPTVSTSIRDVVSPYGERRLVSIADTPGEFVSALANLLRADKAEWLVQVDDFLKFNSWDITWNKMSGLIAAQYRAADERYAAQPAPSVVSL